MDEPDVISYLQLHLEHVRNRNFKKSENLLGNILLAFFLIINGFINS
jgi:hypothetical protein